MRYNARHCYLPRLRDVDMSRYVVLELVAAACAPERCDDGRYSG